MEASHINPFLEASTNVMSQFGINVYTGKPFLMQNPVSLNGKVSIFIGITGNLRGQVILNLDEPVAMTIASEMMGGVPVTEFDEISKSAISELGNMILGHAATMLYNKGLKVDITPPSIIFGDNMKISSIKSMTICIPLELSIGGTMNMNVSIAE